MYQKQKNFMDFDVEQRTEKKFSSTHSDKTPIYPEEDVNYKYDTDEFDDLYAA